jgi:hypothetical protein
MSTSVDQAFIKQYESEVKLAYQRMGSMLRNFCRTSTKSPGADITFPVIGKGAATTKARHAEVAAMNLLHTPKLCTLEDWYAPEYIDKLDQLKTNVELREPYARSSAYALGRKTDELIVTGVEVGTNTTSINLSAITSLAMAQWMARIWTRDVPNGDGQTVAVVSPAVWAKLMSLQEFSNSQWIGPDDLPFKSRVQGKYWAGGMWVSYTGLNGAVTAKRCQAWHRDSIGHGIGADVTTEINYIPEKVSNLVNSFMSQGSVLIDNDGVEELIVNESA